MYSKNSILDKVVFLEYKKKLNLAFGLITIINKAVKTLCGDGFLTYLQI
jgi:hypothetical protein